ncbi:MAG TPA: ABC transporter permease [Blastocatellia bacterium]|nr:ABC transporter permease [Blastocatellia bacterium]
MGTLYQDLAYTFRILGKDIRFTLVAITMLAVGIGLNTAVFSIVNAVLIQPLPYKEPDRLLQVSESHPESQSHDMAATPRSYTEWDKQQQAFESISAYREQYFTIIGGSEPERVYGAVVSGTTFSTLGVSPIHGRVFQPEEEKPGNNYVVVLGHGLWKRRFGEDLNILNQTISFDGRGFVVVGIMPPDFEFPIGNTKVDLWVPLALRPNEIERGGHNLSVVARLRPGVTLERAQAEMNTIAGQLEQQYPETNGGWVVSLEPLVQKIVGGVESTLMILLGAVACVLLITCANIANLFLAKTTAHQKEVAIRVALGASRGRIARLFLTESLVLSCLGGAVGLLLAISAMQFIISIAPDNIPRIEEARIDTNVLGFTLVVSLLTGILFGTVPAIRASRWEAFSVLKEVGAPLSYLRHRNLGSALMVVEIALTLVLSIGAALLINSFIRLYRVDPGLDTERVTIMEVSLPALRYRDAQQQAVFYKSALDRFRSLPEIQSAGLTSSLPLSGLAISNSFVIEGRSTDGSQPSSAGHYIISPDYFRSMGITLLKGRDFTDHDSETTQKVAIINLTMAKRFWGDEDPIGSRMIISGAPPCEVIGIVQDNKRSSLDSEVQPEMYVPFTQGGFFRSGKFVVRTKSESSNIAGALRAGIGSIDKDLAVYNLRTMDQLISESLSKRRFVVLLSGLFAAISIMMALMGVYSVLSYSVNQRRQEFGIRMALGAQQGDVVRLVVKHALLVILVGAVFGLTASLAATQFLTSMLYEITSTNFQTYLIATGLVTVISLIGCYLPARRAAKADPILSLRSE